jgi:glycosyltransferase involved in cell wall biosynthesis
LRIGVDARELQGRPTGTGRYLRNLLRFWGGSEPADEFIAYLSGPEPGDPVLAAPRVRTRAVGSGHDRGFVWRERRLPAVAAADALDVFFAPAYACPLRLDVPRVTTVHDLSFFSHPQDFPYLEGLRRRLTVAASVRVSEAVIAVSPFTHREIAGRFPGADPRIVTVLEGPDDDLPPPPDREAARARLGVSGTLLLSVGSIFNRRCLPDLLQAVALLVRVFPGVRLHVVGDNRTHPHLDLEGLARDRGVARSVRFLGFVSEEELADHYAAADVALALSEYEGFGLPALEALARGVPLVLADRPAHNELFGEAALLVSPRDPIAIARAVGRVLDGAALRQDLSARGRRVAQRFSWSEAARQTLDVLRGAGRRRR